MLSYQAGNKTPKLIIATGTPAPIPIFPTPRVIDIQVISPWKVTEMYTEVNYPLADATKTLYVNAAKIACQLHLTRPLADGHMIVFGPGKAEIDFLFKEITKLLATKPPTYQIYLISSATTREDNVKVLTDYPTSLLADPATEGQFKRKIILGTNTVEASITVDDCGFVVDTLTEKRLETAESGGSRLNLHWISKDSANQRRGRTGRTCNGICYRMCTEAFYSTLIDHRPFEIDRVPLYQVSIELLSVGLDPETTIIGADKGRILKALQMLERLEMIEPTGEITDIGLFAPIFPLDIRNSRFFFNWLRLEYPPFIGLLVASLIDAYNGSYFFFPNRKNFKILTDFQAEADEATSKLKAFVSSDDLSACLKMARKLFIETDYVKVKKGDLSLSKKIGEFSNDNSLNNKKVKEFFEVFRKCVKVCRRNPINLNVEINNFTIEGAIKAARACLIDKAYADKIFFRKEKGAVYEDLVNRETYTLGNSEPRMTTLMKTKPLALISLCDIQIEAGKTTNRIISMALDTDVDATGQKITEKSIKDLRRKLQEEAAQLANRTVKIKIPKTDVLLVAIDFTRYLTVEKILRQLTKKATSRQEKEAADCLERFIMACIEDQTLKRNILADEIKKTKLAKMKRKLTEKLELMDFFFSLDNVDLEAPMMVKLQRELESHHLNGKRSLLLVNREVQTFLQTEDFIQPDVMVETGPAITVTLKSPVGLYSRNLTPDRLTALVTAYLTYGKKIRGEISEKTRRKYETEALGAISKAVCRYASTSSRGQQWSIPGKIYQLLYSQYRFTLEGFASVFNSQILPLRGQFCSLFPDIEGVFGSRGSFFDQTFVGRTIVNPPFVESVLLEVAKKILTALKSRNKVTFYVIFPNWDGKKGIKGVAKEAEGHQLLRKADKFLVTYKVMPANSYYYVDTNGYQDGEVRIEATFPSSCFILTNEEKAQFSRLFDDVMEAY